MSLLKEMFASGQVTDQDTEADVTTLQVQYATKKNLELLVGHHRRFNRYVLATKRLLSSNSLGRTIAVSGLWALYKPPEYFNSPAEWHQTAGPISINLIHEIDILQFLLGPITRVHAEQTVSQRGYPAEEGAAIILRFESGVLGTFLLSDALPSPYNFESGTGENPLIPQDGQDVYRIFGTEGVLSVPDMRLWNYGKKEKSWHETMNMQRIEIAEDKTPFELQVRHLVEVIRGNERPMCSGQEGLSALLVCESVKKAIATSLPVEIPSL
jgi:predicted dehydrogenase